MTRNDTVRYTADVLGSGSTQSTTDEADLGEDDAFWDSLNANVKNLHAVISGHGSSFLPSPFSFFHELFPLQIMATNGVSANRPRTSYSVLTNMQGMEGMGMLRGDMACGIWFSDRRIHWREYRRGLGWRKGRQERISRWMPTILECMT